VKKTALQERVLFKRDNEKVKDPRGVLRATVPTLRRQHQKDSRGRHASAKKRVKRWGAAGGRDPIERRKKRKEKKRGAEGPAKEKEFRNGEPHREF